ncbi:MAG: CotH kinase family protein [Prevotellaceae bacterium]|jgi:hypothetical protein|nr:CotH kinase family protein [Prevotellaceae bacterium]
MKRYCFLICCSIFICLWVNAQNSRKLSGAIIGTTESFDYGSSSCSETVNTIANAFDGNLETIFAACERSGGWAGLDLGKKHVVTQVAYCPRQDEPSPRMLLGVFEGANNPDFGDAIPLYMITEAPAKGTLTQKEVSCSRAFRYVRYVGPNDVKCNLAELEFYGYESEGDDSQLEQLTNLPVVIIHTVNAEDISTDKERYRKGIISIISENGTEIFTDSLEIKGRGNSSWEFPKKPYRIKLYKKAKLLGFPANEKSWTLINNYGDKTLMRNLLAFDLSRRFEMAYTPAGRPVNVILNGEYKGCYQFCDHVQVKDKRVEITEMKKSDTGGSKLTGGYFVEIDAYAEHEISWFRSERHGIPVTIKSPEDDAIVAEQTQYITSHFNSFESATDDANYTDPDAGFRKYLDTATFLRHFLINELAGNTDTYWSTYMYKQREDDKFYVGPVWDFDIAFDNDFRTHPVNNHPEFIALSNGSFANGMEHVVRRLFSDEALRKELSDIYTTYRNSGALSEEALLAVADKYAQELEESQQLNFTRWNIMNERVHMNHTVYGSYQGEVNHVKEYLSERIKWMDKKLGYAPSATGRIDGGKIYCYDDNAVLYVRGLSEEALVKIYNVDGRIVADKQVSNDFSIGLEKGMYIIRVDDKMQGTKTLKSIIN